tara:strand:- start:196 stop:1875 length:1680 start_codon:yes stop_codon:yes gene_type:complete
MTRLSIVNENIPKYEQLLNNIKSDTIIEVIPANVNGISLLHEIIQKYSNIESLHIISHGIPGKIHLGNVKLSIDQLDEYSYFEDINQYFTHNGEILLYGCNVAAYEKGKNFIDTFAEKTGLIVTASTNIVGHSNLRGSWELNYSTGNTCSDVIITQQGQSEWCDTLSHYRGGNLSWTDEGNSVIKLIVTSYWRHDAHDEGLPVLFQPNVSAGNGLITNDIGGDGTGTVTSVEIDDGANHYNINTQTFTIDYSPGNGNVNGGLGNGNYLVTMNSYARISTLQNGADQGFGLETIVRPGSNTSSPITSIPPILSVPNNNINWTYSVPASDPDGGNLTYSLPDPSDGIYGTWSQIAGLSIDPNTGILSLNTTTFTIGHQHTVVIEISNGSTTIPVDFIIEFVESLELPVISSSNLDECVYAGLTYNYNFTASIPSDPTIVLTWAELSALPSNASTSVPTNPLTLTYSPNQSQVGDVNIINLSVTNILTGARTDLNVTFTVKEANIDDLVNIFNCAIKDIGVECDRLSSLDRILCMREKKLQVWKDGQIKSIESKEKLKKSKD